MGKSSRLGWCRVLCQAAFTLTGWVWGNVDFVGLFASWEFALLLTPFLHPGAVGVCECRHSGKKISPIETNNETQPRLCEGSVHATNIPHLHFIAVWNICWAMRLKDSAYWQDVYCSIPVPCSSATPPTSRAKLGMSLPHTGSRSPSEAQDAQRERGFSPSTHSRLSLSFFPRGSSWASVPAAPPTAPFPFSWFLSRSCREEWVVVPAEIYLLKIAPSGFRVHFLVLLFNVWWKQKINKSQCEHVLSQYIRGGFPGTHHNVSRQWSPLTNRVVKFPFGSLCIAARRNWIWVAEHISAFCCDRAQHLKKCDIKAFRPVIVYTGCIFLLCQTIFDFS